jgi:hypothetical protein
MSILKTWQDKLVEFVKIFDLYGLPLTIHYKRNVVYSTCSSVFFSIVLYFILFTTIFVQMKDLYKREKPLSVVEKEDSSLRPLNLSVTNQTDINFLVIQGNDSLNSLGNYIFGFAFYNVEKRKYENIDSTVLTVYSLERTNILNKNSPMQKLRKNIEQINCKDKVLNTTYAINEKNLQLISDFKCFSSPFDLKGEFIEPVYKYFVLKVVMCDVINNKYCKSLEEIDDILKNVVLHYMDVQFYFKTGDSRDPVAYLLNIIPYSLTSSFGIKVDHFLTRERIYSYDSVLPNFRFINYQPKSYSYLKLYETRKYYSVLSDNELLNIYLRSSKSFKIYERRYMDVFKVLALICGVYKLLGLFFHILIFKMNEFYLNLEICNEMFNLIDPENTIKLKENPFISDEGQFKYENISDIVLEEAFKYEKNNLIHFSPLEVLGNNFGIVSAGTQKKLEVMNTAFSKLKLFKDVKILFKFTLNFKKFLKFSLGKKSISQIFLITKLMNKSKFHAQNINNFKIISNIVSYVKSQNETEKDLERKEILRHSLDKYQGLKKSNISSIDLKLLQMLSVDKKYLDLFLDGDI